MVVLDQDRDILAVLFPRRSGETENKWKELDERLNLEHIVLRRSNPPLGQLSQLLLL